jgi:hypothetical protein
MEEQLSFAGEGGDIGITYFNILPEKEYFAPDTLKELSKRFEQDTYEDIYERFFSLLILEHSNTLKPEVRICFLCRDYLNWALLEGNWITYLDFIPVFEKHKLNGIQRQMIQMEDIREYSVRITEKYPDSESGLGGVKYIYHYPNKPIPYYKPFDIEVLGYIGKPSSKKSSFFYFQRGPDDVPNTLPIAG